MPCDSIRTNSVDLSSIGRIDLNLLAAALNALNQDAKIHQSGDVRWITLANGGSYQNGKLELSVYSRVTADQIKQAYSGEVVKATAKRFGWQLKEVQPFKYQVIKR